MELVQLPIKSVQSTVSGAGGVLGEDGGTVGIQTLGGLERAPPRESLLRGEMRGVEFCEKRFSEVGEKLERIEQKKCFSTRRWPGIGDSNGG